MLKKRKILVIVVTMRMYLPALCLVVFTTFLASCDAMSEMLEKQFPQPTRKTIRIRDDPYSPDDSAKMSDIDQDVLLVLTKVQPDPNMFTVSYIEFLKRTEVCALNRVNNLKLFENVVNYWTGSGTYWIFFVLPDKSLSRITWLYRSKGQHLIDAETTLLYNTDFEHPMKLDLDISGMIPL
jgi:hypothetical protein